MMTAPATEQVHTLADLKDAVAGIFERLADAAEPDTFECVDCLKSTADRCGDHGEAAYRQRQLMDAAAEVRAAGSRDDIENIIIRSQGAASE